MNKYPDYFFLLKVGKIRNKGLGLSIRRFFLEGKKINEKVSQLNVFFLKVRKLKKNN